VPPVLLPKNLCAAAVDSVNESAGVDVAVATEVVNSGDSVPALKLVTEPAPAEAPVSIRFPFASMVTACPWVKFPVDRNDLRRVAAVGEWQVRGGQRAQGY
jgi:hypothetical protein